jgi:DNA-directed RNA polymerase specialized sigma24 family protein
VQLNPPEQQVDPDTAAGVERCLESREFLEQLAGAIDSRGDGGEEILAETLMRLVRAVRTGSYQPSRGSLLQFAIGISRRVRMEFARKAQRHRWSEDLPELVDPSVPVDLMMRTEMLDQLNAVMEALSETERDILQKRYGIARGEGGRGAPFTPGERALLHRTIKKLRRLMRRG